MLKVEVKKGNIERALKQLKGKFIRTKVPKIMIIQYICSFLPAYVIIILFNLYEPLYAFVSCLYKSVYLCMSLTYLTK